jgi:hypothetical protein
MRIIAFINEASTVRQILQHLGEAIQPPRERGISGLGSTKVWLLRAGLLPSGDFFEEWTVKIGIDRGIDRS